MDMYRAVSRAPVLTAAQPPAYLFARELIDDLARAAVHRLVDERSRDRILFDHQAVVGDLLGRPCRRRPVLREIPGARWANV